MYIKKPKAHSIPSINKTQIIAVESDIKHSLFESIRSPQATIKQAKQTNKKKTKTTAIILCFEMTGKVSRI